MTRVVLASVVISIMALTTAGCGTPPEAAPPPPAASPSPSSAEDHQEFCGNLNGFATVAGPLFTLIAYPLVTDGETPQNRAKVVEAVGQIAYSGVVLLSKLPKALDDKLRKVVYAAADAKKNLADGTPASKAIAPLETAEIEAARKAVVDYRGSC
ncbi:hypothetical protein [Amycolatopsis sp. H20-H5]|uniref:hypothetical protein n=1 Tax=Amycolatopsis sp. H20-H5 TaxID=3046309 RepID=UPI002DBECB65|nr:hypothetical protein [Amycolatopsis sp. H20-H5]MEC3976336.1 hypothetical protein [Amycolatopsis sp. H20-H5]